MCRMHVMAQGSTFALECVQTIDLRDLARLYELGMRCLRVATDTCETCKIAPLSALTEQVDDFNRLLQSRDMPEIRLSRAGKRALDGWKKAEAESFVPDASKRAFFRALVVPEETEEPPKRDALHALFEKSGPTVLFPFAPHIDAEKCTGCDDCVNICPHGALIRIKVDNGRAVYTSAANRCTGCNLCGDICDSYALEVQKMSCSGADIPLVRYQCRACGATAHTTDAQIPADGLCRVCHKTNHHKNLFVVLE